MLRDTIAFASQWLAENGTLAAVLLGVSAVAFVASLLLIPWIVVRLPSDYFVRRRRPRLPWQIEHSVLRWTLLIAKNLLGGVLLVGGLVMLFTPGPGLVALLIGLSLLDLPGKRALQRRIISRPSIYRAINRMRAKYGRPALQLPDGPHRRLVACLPHGGSQRWARDRSRS